MILSTTLEKIFYHYSRTNLDLFFLVTPDFFQNKDIKLCAKLDKKFFDKYQNLPTKSQMEQMVSTIKENEGIEPDDIEAELEKIRSIFNVRLNEYSVEWLKENAEAWIEWKTLDSSFFDAINYMKTTKVDVNNIKEVVEKVKSIILDRNNINFQFSLGLDFFNPEDHIITDEFTKPTGYPFFDECLRGGYRKGTLIAVVAPPKVGKSLFLGNMAIQSMKQGDNVAFISLEMGDKEVIERVGSNILNVSIKKYKDFSSDPERVKKRLNKFRKMDTKTFKTPGSLYIKQYPTSSTGVPEIEQYLKKVEQMKNIKFSAIFIDYINIMLNWRNPNSENTYMKIKQLAEDLRAMGMRNEWTIVTASQIKRDGVGVSDLTMKDISESMGLAHTVDAMFGVLQDEEQKANGVYIVKAILLRMSGFIGWKKRFLVDYDCMRITEDEETSSYSMADLHRR